MQIYPLEIRTTHLNADIVFMISSEYTTTPSKIDSMYVDDTYSGERHNGSLTLHNEAVGDEQVCAALWVEFQILGHLRYEFDTTTTRDETKRLFRKTAAAIARHVELCIGKGWLVKSIVFNESGDDATILADEDVEDCEGAHHPYRHGFEDSYRREELFPVETTAP